MADVIVNGLKALTAIVHIILVLCILLLAVHRPTAGKVWNWFGRNRWTAFVVAAVAALGSLYLSNVAGYTPCTLCWWQRIFMYPLSIILLISLWLKDRHVFRYVVPLALIGAAFSAYHYVIQMVPADTSCGIDGVSCTASPFFAYGYITIPMMALTAFVLIILILLASRNPRST